MSRIMCLLFTTTFDSHLSISITLQFAFAITYTYVDCCISTYTLVDGYTSASTTFSSPMSVFVICASTKCYSTTLSSSDFSMNIKSIIVALGPICSLAHQCLLLLHKNTTSNVPIVSMS
jgi:hypothetical protein